MIVKERIHRDQLEMFSIEEYVPADHLLRKIDSAVDFIKDDQNKRYNTLHIITTYVYYIIKVKINQCEALYILNSARNCISSTLLEVVYHHCESFLIHANA